MPSINVSLQQYKNFEKSYRIVTVQFLFKCIKTHTLERNRVKLEEGRQEKSK